jgi:hypothetical protein
MLNEIHVFDCDGVLVDSSHRYRTLPSGTIDLPHWIENNTPDKVARDTLRSHYGTYATSLKNSSIYTIIATARQCIKHDFDYFRSVIGWPNKLIYRQYGDTRSDWKIKLAGLRQLLGLRQFRTCPVTVWEDNSITIRELARRFPDWTYNYIQSNQGA